MKNKRTSARRRRQPSSAPLRFERLEARRVLAASLDIDTGLLQVEGTEGRDEISVQLAESNLIVDCNGDVQTFGVDSVSSIEIYAKGGKDHVEIGADVLIDAMIDAGADKDKVWGGGGNDTIYGREDKDKIWGRGGDDLIFGGADKDKIWGGEGDDTIYGEDNKDKLWGGEGNDVLLGGGDKDKLYGENGDDSLDGGDDKDKLYGGLGNDSLIGGRGKDKLKGDDGDDDLDGGDDNDKLDGGAGNDHILGGGGNDKLKGGDGDDDMDGGGGNDKLNGGDGDDEMDGGAGKDRVNGGRGTDFIQYDQHDKAKGGYVLDMETEFEAELNGVNGSVASGEAEFELEEEHAEGLEVEFSVEIEDADALTTYEVFVHGESVGTFQTDVLGRGELELSNDPEEGEATLPESFPKIEAGVIVSVRKLGESTDILTGTFDIELEDEDEEESEEAGVDSASLT